ncbi:MAG: helix-turn-helix domain-containing protein [Candidatus Eremiobacteraeota bacterium]|nr:helix-turn-helix domain-containing protein [Candidatus Eremiobacteraeota bacterium]
MVKKTRTEKKISLSRMAKDLRSSKSALARYESGEREWPAELYRRVLVYLGLETEQPEEHWSWKKHRAYWDSYRVERDSGASWADYQDGYPDFYRNMDTSKRPSLSFRKQVRSDSMLENCLHMSFCAAGAECAYISLVALNFPYHPLVDEENRPMSMARRAAFVLDGWIWFPQVTLLVNGLRIRLDYLGCNGKDWAGIEADGNLHARNAKQKEWDEKRDRSLGFKILRFSQAEILSGHIINLIRQRLKELPGRKAG